MLIAPATPTRTIRSGGPTCWPRANGCATWEFPRSVGTFTIRSRKVSSRSSARSGGTPASAIRRRPFPARTATASSLAANDLDYTWNWVGYGEHQAVINAFPAPRFNSNIDASPAAVKRCLLQNSYMNVQPRKPDGANGSDWIVNHPELSQALKQCARLHSQFLPYFVDGIVIGDCILEKPCGGAAVGAFVLPGKVLVIVLNTGAKGEKSLDYHLAPWIPSSSGRYAIKSYDGHGRLLAAGQVAQPRGRLTSGALEPLDLALFEIVSQ